MPATALESLELDLDVFAGPFDLLLALVLREELDLLEVELGEVVLAYIDHLEAREELDLEATTEFLVLIAALLDLKSRLMLPGERLEELDDLAPAVAAEELLERMLEYARYRGAGGHLAARHADGQALLWRSAPLPAELRRMPLAAAEAAYDAAALGRALGALLRRGAFSFDEAVRGAGRTTVAVTLFALLELYKRGEAGWEQAEPFGPITVRAGAA